MSRMTDERRVKIAAGMRRMWADPETRERRRAACQANLQAWQGKGRPKPRNNGGIRRLSWPAEWLEALRQMRAEGRTIRECADRIGIGYRQTHLKCIELGINRLPGYTGGHPPAQIVPRSRRAMQSSL